ncbi:hypothetical protein [Rhodoblastus sp.]|uniref:hypothetical protein n=1 Tax=Rhodoblastus sp. TaxID=1962975 RepID=UPI003F98B609
MRAPYFDDESGEISRLRRDQRNDDVNSDHARRHRRREAGKDQGHDERKIQRDEGSQRHSRLAQQAEYECNGREDDHTAVSLRFVVKGKSAVVAERHCSEATDPWQD